MSAALSGSWKYDPPSTWSVWLRENGRLFIAVFVAPHIVEPPDRPSPLVISTADPPPGYPPDPSGLYLPMGSWARLDGTAAQVIESRQIVWDL